MSVVRSKEKTPTTPTATEEPEKQELPETEKKPMNVLPIAGVLLALIACGGGYLMLQTKKASEQRPDPDADYAEDEEEYVIPEDDEPEPVEDESDYDAEPEGSKE